MNTKTKTVTNRSSSQDGSYSPRPVRRLQSRVKHYGAKGHHFMFALRPHLCVNRESGGIPWSEKSSDAKRRTPQFPSP